MNKIQKDFKVDWVLINKLCIGIAPLSKNHLNVLREEGVSSILSLCSEDEVKLPSDLGLFFNHKRYVLPDHKTGRPPTLNEIDSTLVILSELMKSDKPVFIHCVASVERSPLICMAWLIKKHNLNKFQSLNYLMQKNKGTCPTTNQLKILDNLLVT